MSLHGALSVFRFELRRSATPSRVAVWLLLVSFPIFIVSVMKYYEDDFERENNSSRHTISIGHDGKMRATLELPDGMSEAELGDYIRDLTSGTKIPPELAQELSRMLSDAELRDYMRDVAAGKKPPADLLRELAKKRAEGTRPPEVPPEEYQTGYPVVLWSFVFFALIPEVITLFGLLLWVTPMIHAEMEGRTWIYLAVRPRGRLSVLLGKYLTAVVWTALAGWTSTTICVLVARPEDALRLWTTTMVLVGLSGVAYAAIYALIGVWLHRRAMVIAVAYTLIFEFLVSFIPAVINKLTIQYRLRNLLVHWMDMREVLESEAGRVFIGDEPTWVHILVLAGIVVGVLLVAAQVVQRKEYATASDV